MLNRFPRRTLPAPPESVLAVNLCRAAPTAPRRQLPKIWISLTNPDRALTSTRHMPGIALTFGSKAERTGDESLPDRLSRFVHRNILCRDGFGHRLPTGFPQTCPQAADRTLTTASRIGTPLLRRRSPNLAIASAGAQSPCGAQGSDHAALRRYDLDKRIMCGEHIGSSRKAFNRRTSKPIKRLL